MSNYDQLHQQKKTDLQQQAPQEPVLQSNQENIVKKATQQAKKSLQGLSPEAQKMVNKFIEDISKIDVEKLTDKQQKLALDKAAKTHFKPALSQDVEDILIDTGLTNSRINKAPQNKLSKQDSKAIEQLYQQNKLSPLIKIGYKLEPLQEKLKHMKSSVQSKIPAFNRDNSKSQTRW